MNIAEKVIDIVKGMEGIGGIPTDEEFLNEFEFRLQALKQGQKLPIDSVSKCYTEKDMDNAYDKGFNDGSQRDLTGSLIEVL